MVISAVAISKGYLRGRPRPLFAGWTGWMTAGVYIAVGCCGSSGCNCTSNSGLLAIKSDFGLLAVKYSFTTIDRKVVGPLGNLIV